MTKTVLTLLCACLVSLAHAGNRQTTPADLARIEQLQRQADKLGFATLDANDYALSKARAWLDLALDEYHEQDRTGIVQDATAEAAMLLRALETRQAFDAGATPHPYASEKIRPDLWDKVESMKRHPEFSCAARRIAELEVQLVWTGHEKWESGWDHAEPYARIAENLAYEARVALEDCAAKKSPVRVSAPAPTPTPMPTLIIERRTLATDALFAFDRSGIEYLAMGGREKLDSLADELVTWPSLERITLTGHTDRLGSEDYNRALSERRASQIKDYLANRGLPAEHILTEGLGESQPVVSCSVQRSRKTLIECLQPNRRVELSIQGVRK